MKMQIIFLCIIPNLCFCQTKSDTHLNYTGFSNGNSDNILTCTNWLRTQAVGQSVTVGDLDISGNQMTIEANFNCSSFPISRPDKWEDIVSKHANTTDANYVLRMDLAAITTTTAHYLTPPPSPCFDLVINKTYHVALVYDGSMLKLYRNGIVISQMIATGNLILNNWSTTIGDYAVNNPVGTNFLGYINEVRIWNVARTQSQLQAYMDIPLPNPTTQTGLLGYYTFDNLINKQGNAAYNGTLNGGATINNTNPNCTFDPGQSSIVANAGNDTSYCSNTTISHQLLGNGNGTYSWTPAAYLNNPTLQNPIATINATTTFYLTVTGAGPCSAIDSVTITVNPVPLVQTLIDTAICRNAVLVLTTTGASTYQWSPATYVNDPTIPNPTFIDTVSRQLVVTGTNSFGCFDDDTINITVNPLPLVRTIKDTSTCSTQPITLTTTGAVSYSWSPVIFLSNPNIANPVFSGNTSQTYHVTGTGSNGCLAKDTVSVTVIIPMVFQAPPDKSMCNTGSVQLDGYNGTSVNYLWSPATYLSSTTIINPIANPPSTSTYSVLITEPFCNTSNSFNVQVIVGAGPIINASKSNDIDCANRSAVLYASGGDTYLWSPSTGLSNPNIPNPVATPTATQKYIVIVSTASGCSGIDSVTVFSNSTASLARYMPNAFTPNEDGKNDCYGLKSWLNVKKFEFRIFNRYGEQVFATANPSACWDGNYKGKKADGGTYVFYIKADTDCGTEEQKGSFLLIR